VSKKSYLAGDRNSTAAEEASESTALSSLNVNGILSSRWGTYNEFPLDPDLKQSLSDLLMLASGGCIP
jgi:hypothetical protein